MTTQKQQLLFYNNQYLDEKELVTNIGILDVNEQDLGSTDTYDESRLLKKIQQLVTKFKDENFNKIITTMAIQLAIIGFGSKNYNFIKIDGKEANMIDLFKKYDIKYQQIQNAKLEADDLTPRRLIRLFRFHIKKFIEKTGKTSYMWNKYCSNKDFKFKTITFPGAEHLVVNQDEINHLLSVADNIGEINNFKLKNKFLRVFIARGLKIDNSFHFD
jgi:hypothetical protein